jgi:hypothetical protein
MTTGFQWYVLVPSDDGLVRSDGFQASGTWRFQPPQDLNYGPATTAGLFLGLDYSFTWVTMLDSPRKMRWSYSALGGASTIYAYIGP